MEGKWRNLRHRTKCLSCSPFQSGRKSATGKVRACRTCGRNFHYSREKGHTLSICNSCCAGVARDRLKVRCLEYLGGSCVRCGYNRCVEALEFHHRTPESKLFGISGAYTRRWDAVRQELDKCDLVCANCHREIESKVRASLAQSGKSAPPITERASVQIREEAPQVIPAGRPEPQAAL